jgi:hypothetical protein
MKLLMLIIVVAAMALSPWAATTAVMAGAEYRHCQYGMVRHEGHCVWPEAIDTTPVPAPSPLPAIDPLPWTDVLPGHTWVGSGGNQGTIFSWVRKYQAPMLYGGGGSVAKNCS